MRQRLTQSSETFRLFFLALFIFFFPQIAGYYRSEKNEYDQKSLREKFRNFVLDAVSSSRIIVLLALMFHVHASSYRFEAGDLFGSAGCGVSVNVARMDKPSPTPGAELPLLIGADYLVDGNWGLFGAFMPSFAAGNLGFGLRVGGKYWFTNFDFPLFPYASLALTPNFGIPFKGANHFNLGLSPGVGAVYFVMAKFTLGAHVHFNPSIAWGGGERKFEFAVMPFIDAALRI